MAFMQPGTRKILRFLGNWIINTASVALTVIILRNHISYGDKPENLLIALPLLIFTLGLFTLVINALLLCLLTKLLPFFHVDSFGYAFLGALIISVISVALNGFTGNSRITIQRNRPPPPPPPGGKNDGNGPVIDV